MKREPLYKKYENTTPISTMHLSNWGGLEILDILHGIDDYAVASFNFGTRQQIRRHKIQTAPSGRLFIRKQGTRFYLDEIMKVW